MRISFETMHETVTQAFIKAGMSPEDARVCARIHTESSCDGVYSHGLNRVARFVDYLQRGWVDADAKPVAIRKLGVIELYDGQRGPGILNALFATDRAMGWPQSMASVSSRCAILRTGCVVAPTAGERRIKAMSPSAGPIPRHACPHGVARTRGWAITPSSWPCRGGKAISSSTWPCRSIPTASCR